MDTVATIRELIDLRSFSSMWYWIGLAVAWSAASQRVLGIPYDMINRARRQQDQAMSDVEALAAVHVRRILLISGVSGQWIVGLWAFWLMSLALLAVQYQVEFAQAVLLLLAPFTFVAIMAVMTARRIQVRDLGGAALVSALMRHRLVTQFTGILAIFVTAMWGMYTNLTIGGL